MAEMVVGMLSQLPGCLGSFVCDGSATRSHFYNINLHKKQNKTGSRDRKGGKKNGKVAATGIRNVSIWSAFSRARERYVHIKASDEPVSRCTAQRHLARCTARVAPNYFFSSSATGCEMCVYDSFLVSALSP